MKLGNRFCYHNLTEIIGDVVDPRHADVVSLHHADDVELRQTLCKVAEQANLELINS